MTSTVRSLAPQYPVIEVTHSGKVTSADLRASTAKALDMARSMDAFHLLTDCTDLAEAPDDIALLALGERLRTVSANLDFRQALLWPKDAEARLAVDFWQTTETDFGAKAKVFSSRDAAIAWLTS